MREIAEYRLEIDEIVRAAVREAIAHEREACAEIAMNDGCGRRGCRECVGGNVAANIRAR